MNLHKNIQRTLFTVGDFVGWMRNSELELSPSFQRRPVWPAKAKSFLIDTVARGLPMPIVFLRERTDIKTLRTIREVVDGQQRIRTLLSFIDPNSLRDFHEERDRFVVTKNHNKEISGKRFPDFPDDLKHNILSYQIPAHVFTSDTSDDQILDIFRRMNATGVKLNDQELRNSEYFGNYIQSVYNLATVNLDKWRNWKLFSEQDIARMQEAEFISELYSLQLHGVQEKKQSLIEHDYKEFDELFPARDHLEKRTQHILDRLDELLGSEIASTKLSNRIVFYPVFAALCDHFYGLDEGVSSQAKRQFTAETANRIREVLRKLEEVTKLPQDVQSALSGRSNQRENRLAVTRFIARHLS